MLAPLATDYQSTEPTPVVNKPLISVDIPTSVVRLEPSLSVVFHPTRHLSGPPVFVEIRSTRLEAMPLRTFQFTEKNLLGEGVEDYPREFMGGCMCRPDNRRHIGCECTECSCLEQAATRRFPYLTVGIGKGTFRRAHLESRDAIFECNDHCNGREDCKTRWCSRAVGSGQQEHGRHDVDERRAETAARTATSSQRIRWLKTRCSDVLWPTDNK